jgi:hypothetical protein
MARQRKAKVRLVPCEWRIERDGRLLGTVMDRGTYLMPKAIRFALLGCDLAGLARPTRAAAVAALIAAKESDK